MNDPLLHILIIWSNGSEKEDEIVEDIRSSFGILNRFEVHWDAHYFKENLKRFYAHSLQDKSPKALEAILTHKMEHCGTESFTALVFEDDSPNLVSRPTSNGTSLVNANVFDKKALYRSWLGGGHKIHASDTFYETNKDLMLLFGYCGKDFVQNFPANQSIVKYAKNIVGVPFFNSVKQLFEVLNQTISYVVLRNYEALPEAYFVADHGDIDMLVENVHFMRYLTGAVDCYPTEKNRVYHTIVIDSDEVPFDFRFVGDSYYDTQWELAILNKRRLHPRGFYVPNEEDYFYSLLYHAYVQKRKISPDYKERLQHIAENAGITYHASQTEEKTHELLHAYMSLYGYVFTLPKDHTVFFNKKFIEQIAPTHTEAGRRLVTSSISRTDTTSYLTEVFETKHGFLKIANAPIVGNEIEFLTKMEHSGYVPKILSSVLREHTSEVLLEKINGISLSAVLKSPNFWTFKNLKQFSFELVELLKELAQADIMHRDIRPANIMVVKTAKGFEPRLIDFGWSTTISEREHTITPNGLGHIFKYPNEGFSDAHSMGKCLEYCARNLNFLDPIVHKLLAITPDHYHTTSQLIELLEEVQEALHASHFKMGRKDVMALWVKRWKINDRMTKLLGEKRVAKIKKML